MREQSINADRLNGFSDAVFAVIVTVMVLELKAPEEATAYNIFEHEVLVRADPTRVSARMRRMARRRSLVVLVGFAAAMLVATVAPRLGFGLICAALVLHLRP